MDYKTRVPEPLRNSAKSILAKSPDLVVCGDTVLILTELNKKDTATCPKCGKKTSRLHQQELRFVRDLPCFGKRTILIIFRILR